MKKDIFGYIRRIKKEKKLIKKELETGKIKRLNMRRDMLLLAHSLEKGMGIENPKQGFGIIKAGQLVDLLSQYFSGAGKESDFEYIEGVSVLRKYLEYSSDIGTDVNLIAKKAEMLFDTDYSFKAGAEWINMPQLYEKMDQKAVEYFIKSRHSIRSFKNIKVDEWDIREASKLAQMAPSACNRQPSKIYWTTDCETVQKMNDLIPGNKGFEQEIPNWAIITVERSFFNRSEYFQWYVNGGIFVAYFTEGLHANKIGSCIFQIPIDCENTPLIRKLAKIPDTEAIIAAVGFGYAKDDTRILSAARRMSDETMVKF